MTYLRRALTCAVFLWPIGRSCPAQEPPAPWSEPEVIERFLSQSAQSRELRARVASIEAELRSRLVYQNPSVSYSREGAGYTEFFEISQVLPVSSRIRYLRDANASAVSAAGANRDASLWSL